MARRIERPSDDAPARPEREPLHETLWDTLRANSAMPPHMLTALLAARGDARAASKDRLLAEQLRRSRLERALSDQARARRKKGRSDQVDQRKSEWLNTFRKTVWPALAPCFGRSGWRDEALRLCALAGIAASERTLERRIAAARADGVPIPWLRVKRRTP